MPTRPGRTSPPCTGPSRRFERAGLAGVHIEDEVDPKHSPWDGPLLPDRRNAGPDRGGREGPRRSDDFVIMVRTNEFQVANGGGNGSLEGPIKRGVAYAEAGADALHPDVRDEEQVREIAAEVQHSRSADTRRCFLALQFSLFTGYGVVAAAHAHYEMARHVFEHGTLPERPGRHSQQEWLTRQPDYDDVIVRWARRTGRPVRTLPPW